MTRHVLIADDRPLPDEGVLDAFWALATEARPDLEGDYQVRSIGRKPETADMILDFIKAGTKVATFSLPWVLTAEGFPESTPGTPIILVDYHGVPRVVVRLTGVRETTFGAIGVEETSMDGPPVQDPEVWLPLHRSFWDGLLASYGKRCSNDMPVLIEPFEVVFSKGQ